MMGIKAVIATPANKTTLLTSFTSVLRWALDRIDHQNFNRPLTVLQLQSELFLNSSEHRRAVRSRFHTGFELGVPLQFYVVQSCQIRFIDEDAIELPRQQVPERGERESLNIDFTSCAPPI